MARNTIIVHDSFPFTELSIISLLRKLILYLSLFLSDCSLGFINKTDSYKFATSLKNISFLGKHHIVFLPNIFPEFDVSLFSKNSEFCPLKIGLCGSNSSKKNFTKFVESLLSHNVPVDKIKFVVYGFETSYIRSVIRDSPYQFLIFDSTLHSFESFASNINVLACVSFAEGFCRPVAALSQSQIPVLLLNTPTLVEFYSSSSSSVFFNSIDEISLNINLRIQSLVT
ncbi:hypothetical protein [Synechococcus sp. UW140]|uniref:hypothetical protein n=1 Tax=Synechococcus sp. UW140 TaxID=368503 RepID=UPI003138156C